MMEFQFKYTSKLLIAFFIGSILSRPMMSQDLDSLAIAKSDSISLSISAQDTLIDASLDSVGTYGFVSDISFVVDYGKLIGMISDFESKGEVGIELGFKERFFAILEYGRGSLTPNDAYTNTNYKSKGNYFRIGAGYRKALSDKTNMAFSIRYGSARFSDEGTIKIESSSGLFEPVNDQFNRTNLSANWYEVVLQSESELRTNLYAGFHMRLRVMNSYDAQTPIDVYSIPGYGRTFDSSLPAFNLYIKYKLNFTK